LKRPLKPGDEVITIAAGFPTTVNPIIQLGMIPVFVDVDIRTYNVNVEQLAHMIGPKTRAIMLAHTLGNPFNIKNILQIVYGNSLYLIEDCCDALGSVYDCNHPVGHWSDISTYSFYPAHHITMGEGGCVCTNDALYNKIIRSFRDWGRDCFCNSGINNSCNSRYSHSDSELPNGYDHKYIYSHIGYNLKATEMQAAIGLEQLKKLPEFIKRRKENFNLWQEGFQAFRRFFILPEATENTDPAWFAYPITIKDSRAFTRNMLTIYLENHGIETRNLFGGNLLRQPMYKDVVYSQPENGLPNTDKVMNDTFFLGTYPGLTKEQINYIIVTIQEFITSRGY
jgi:CDP-6-deoxy-D-xylo-4-hexulose-3-dehydrase